MALSMYRKRENTRDGLKLLDALVREHAKHLRGSHIRQYKPAAICVA